MRYAAVLAAVVALTAVSNAEARARPDCRQSGTTVYHRSDQRVFRLGSVVYACRGKGPIVRLGRDRTLGPADGRPAVGLFAAQYRYLAYVEDCGRNGRGNSAVIVRDMDTGRVTRQATTDGRPSCDHAQPWTVVDGAPLLTQYGDVAWQQSAYRTCGSERCADRSIWQWDADGLRQVAAGDEQLHELRRRGDSLCWTQGTAPECVLTHVSA